MYRFSIFATMVLVLNAPAAFSQAVGIGTSNPHSSAQLEISATQKGILIPRVALTGLSDKTTITTPAASLLVYNSNNTLPGGAGFYYWTGTVWAKLITPSDLVNYSGNWGTSGNGGTNAANFIGTTDNQPLRFRANNSLIGLLDHSHINFGFGNGVLGNITTGSSNIALGSGAGSSLTTGAFNIAIGENVMMHETDSNNTVMGVSAMINNSGHRNTLFGVRTFTGVSTSSGNNNTALGYEAMRNAKGGSNNVAVGLHALYKADGRSNLVAIGDSAMYSLTTGNKNMAVGSKALKTNILGTYNLALGNEALYSATGSRNIAIGNDAMRSVQIGFSSTALGNSALFAQSNPVGQIAIGDSAMYSVTAGSYNTVIGTRALGKIASPGPSRNTIIGAYASADITTASNNNTIIGSYAMRNTAGNDNVVIGDSAQTGVATASIQNNVLIGKSVAAGNKQMSHTVAIGYKAMANITDGGDRNIAIGSFAMGSAPFGERNIGIGDSALFRNPLMDNVAIGAGALLNMTGDRNIALGYHALYKAEAGTANIAIGRNAAAKGVDPGSVVAIGDSALYSVDALDFDGARSTAIGHKALKNTSTGFLNTAIGYSSGQGNITGNRLTLIGHGADVTTDGLNNATAIGANATVSANNTMAFGNSNVERWVFGLGTTSAGAPSKALEVAATGRPGNGAYLTAGGVWTNTSDVTLKENFSEVNSEDILQKIMQLPISRWRYKGTDEFHIGPMAQDFYALFQVGIDEKHISTIDPNGIALLAIQQLKQENTELQKLLTGLQERIALLEKEIIKEIMYRLPLKTSVFAALLLLFSQRVHAQLYSGGNGTGSYHVVAKNIALSAADSLYNGGIGSGSFSVIQNGMSLYQADSLYNGGIRGGDFLITQSGLWLAQGDSIYNGGDKSGDFVLTKPGISLTQADSLYNGGLAVGNFSLTGLGLTLFIADSVYNGGTAQGGFSVIGPELLLAITDSLYNGGLGQGMDIVLTAGMALAVPDSLYNGGSGMGYFMQEKPVSLANGCGPVATWNGSVDQNWDNPLNWDCQNRPTFSSYVVIPSEKPRYPIIGNHTSVRKIQLRPGATLSVAKGVNLRITGE